MTVDTNNVPEPSILDQLKIQLMQFNVQKQQSEINLHQLNGAIFACEQIIKKHAEEDKLGEQQNGEVNNES